MCCLSALLAILLRLSGPARHRRVEASAESAPSTLHATTLRRPWPPPLPPTGHPLFPSPPPRALAAPLPPAPHTWPPWNRESTIWRPRVMSCCGLGRRGVAVRRRRGARGWGAGVRGRRRLCSPTPGSRPPDPASPSARPTCGCPWQAHLVVRHVLVGVDRAPAALLGLAGLAHLQAGALDLGMGRQGGGRSARDQVGVGRRARRGPAGGCAGTGKLRGRQVCVRARVCACVGFVCACGHGWRAEAGSRGRLPCRRAPRRCIPVHGLAGTAPPSAMPITPRSLAVAPQPGFQPALPGPQGSGPVPRRTLSPGRAPAAREPATLQELDFGRSLGGLAVCGAGSRRNAPVPRGKGPARSPLALELHSG
jgi:hypothetical protein